MGLPDVRQSISPGLTGPGLTGPGLTGPGLGLPAEHYAAATTRLPRSAKTRHLRSVLMCDMESRSMIIESEQASPCGIRGQLERDGHHRDDDTGNHVLRVGRYAAVIAQRMGYPEHRLRILEQAARLHDIGKSEIPDTILFKPGRLTPDEYALMQEHCAIGRRMIDPLSGNDWSLLRKHPDVSQNLRRICSCPVRQLAAMIAQTHHEYWNGNGYPLKLKGEAIPLEGRIVAVADVFDALSSRRPYKQPFPLSKCLEILWQQRGIQFDPAVIDAFLGCSAEIARIRTQFMDNPDCAGRAAHKRQPARLRNTAVSSATAHELRQVCVVSGLALPLPVTCE